MLLQKWSFFTRAVHNAVQRNRRCIIVVITVLFICVLYYALYEVRFMRSVPLELLHYQRLLKENKISSGRCDVPYLVPWDSTILKYYHKPKPLKCKALQNNVTVLRDGLLMIFPEYRDKLKCRCRTFGHNTGVSDSDVKYDDWTDINSNEGLRITKEFVEVECYSKGLISPKVYSYHWNQIVKRNISIRTKRKVEISNGLPGAPATMSGLKRKQRKGVAVYTFWKNYWDENSYFQNPIVLSLSMHSFRASSADRPSVLLFGVDSMSQSNFIRTLPKTYAQLQNMGFVNLRRHVKVGDNTFVNLGAVLTGKRSTATREFRNELTDEWNIYFDDWPFVWNVFSDKGYVTLFAEDRPDIGTFNYFGWLCGFKYPPTDHYFRPYWLATYWKFLFRRSSPGCYNEIPAHNLQLNYLSEFLTKYDGTRSFALHWTQDLSHDYLNAINVADEDFERFFIESAAKFNNTIVIVFSDHGHRYDAIRETVVGRLEARLPFASVLLPKEFVRKYPHTLKALRQNADKMTTQFDFYATLINIAVGNFSSVGPSEEVQRAYSLLGGTPETRQCFEANIPEDYCPCFEEVQLDANESEEAANELLNFVNGQLEQMQGKAQFPHIKGGFTCSKLVLERIEYASVLVPPVKVVQDPQVGGKIAIKGLQISYRIVIRMKAPSEALFEGIVMKDLTNNVWKVTGEIERNNKYGNTSHCVLLPLLKKLCYCVPLPT